MINGAHSHSAIRGGFSVDNGDGSQLTSLLKLGFITGFLDPKISTFSRLFPKTTVSFSGLKVMKILVIDRDLKKSRNKCFFMIQT